MNPRLRLALAIAVALALLQGMRWAALRPIARAPGVLVDAEPLQTAPADATPVAHGDYTLTPLADFTIEARVLSRMDYRMGAFAAVSPTDFALGWQRMSDTAVIDQLDISQSARFYSYRWAYQPPLPPAEITHTSTNLHAIPADAMVARSLDRVRQGTLVTLRGQLVAVTGRRGELWRSSLSRDDTGAGACEIMLIRDIMRRD